MTYAKIINCGDGYKTKITAESVHDIETAMRHPSVATKRGEDLVSALIEHCPGNIRTVERYKNDKRNDSPTDLPAFQQFNTAGTVHTAVRYKDGKRLSTQNREK
jgi:hypothetical protein